LFIFLSLFRFLAGFKRLSIQKLRRGVNFRRDTETACLNANSR
jgi:hypothetical protein